MTFEESSVKVLTDIGLNDLEARVYLALLKEPAITGYRVGKSLGKPVSNVYQALESLAKKGVVVLSAESGKRNYYPVPVKDVVARLKSDLERKSQALQRELEDIQTPPTETGIYRIENREQLFGKIDSLLDRSDSTVLITADALFLRRLQPRLEEVAQGGVRVLVLGYEEMEFESCEFLKLTPKEGGPWTGHWIVIDFDCTQHLIAFFETPEVLTHAIWCNDRYVSYWIHFGMLADFTLMSFFEQAYRTGEYGELSKRLHSLYSRYNPSNPDLSSISSVHDSTRE
jgi:sugar-specific transcriptional regulator TrmB